MVGHPGDHGRVEWGTVDSSRQNVKPRFSAVWFHQRTATRPRPGNLGAKRAGEVRMRRVWKTRAVRKERTDNIRFPSPLPAHLLIASVESPPELGCFRAGIAIATLDESRVNSQGVGQDGPRFEATLMTRYPIPMLFLSSCTICSISPRLSL